MFKQEDIKLTVDVKKDMDSLVERNWRNVELTDCDIKINILFDDSEDYSKLSAYRKALRAYPEASDFPYGDRPELSA